MEAVYTPSGEGVNPGVRASPGSALALSHPSSCGKVSAGKIVGQHDLSYRLFFSHRRMIQDLLREIVGERWVECIDLESGEEPRLVGGPCERSSAAAVDSPSRGCLAAG